MKGVKVLLSEGEEIRLELLEKGLFASGYRIAREEGYLIIPVIDKIEGYDTVEYDFEAFETGPTFKERVEKIVGEELVGELRTYDSIGDIAIMEITEPLEVYAKKIAEAFLKSHGHYRTVLAKTSALEGEFRTRSYTHLAGAQKTTTVHKEYGLRFEMDLNKVFFSPRLATERQRVASMVSPGETIIDMFCGVGPFSIFIDKYAEPKAVYSIDLNPDAIRYLKRNIILNKVNRITPICGDAKSVVHTLPQGDRILMNLPKFSHMFLADAIGAAAENGMVHYYTIVEEDDEEKHFRLIDEQKGNREFSIESIQKIKPYSPYSYMTCFDIRISS